MIKKSTKYNHTKVPEMIDEHYSTFQTIRKNYTHTNACCSFYENFKKPEICFINLPVMMIPEVKGMVIFALFFSFFLALLRQSPLLQLIVID